MTIPKIARTVIHPSARLREAEIGEQCQVPARPLRDRFSPAIAERLRRIAWWDWPFARIRAHRALFQSDDIAAFRDAFDPEGGRAAPDVTAEASPSPAAAFPFRIRRRKKFVPNSIALSVDLVCTISPPCEGCVRPARAVRQNTPCAPDPDCRYFPGDRKRCHLNIL